MIKKALLLLWYFLGCYGALQATDHKGTSALLRQLDEAIGQRPLYQEQKQRTIDKLKQDLNRQTDDKERFDRLGELIDEYRSFNTDLAMQAAKEREAVAEKLQEQILMDNARMNIADVMSVAGMYKEVIDLMKDIHISRLPEYLHAYYYHLYRTTYGLMADYAVTTQEKEHYRRLTDCYRDSLLEADKGNPLIQTIIRADQYNVYGQYDNSIRLLENYLNQKIDDMHKVAICAYTLSEAYRLKGDKEKEKEYLIRSSIADMKTAVREYVSLRKLAVLLYEEGDIDRAYTYVKICLADASACNARLRKLEILEIFPIIDKAYRMKEEKQQATMKWSLIAISLLSIFLLISIFYVYKQMKRVAAARREVVTANRRLKELNEELHRSNEQLKEANRSIAENSYLKEEYIGRYMDLCSIYIEKMDNYRRALGKIASSGNVEELYKKIKSSKFIESELKEFYANFDNSFLQLFPSFVEEFNMLLADGEQIYPKQGERMNTELRIFALIRLGITDSTKIAQFLRYSVTTIYNYRTKVRNKAAGERDRLEQEVMRIGKI